MSETKKTMSFHALVLLAGLTLQAGNPSPAIAEFSLGEEVLRNADFSLFTDQWNLYSARKANADYGTYPTPIPAARAGTIYVKQKSGKPYDIRLLHAVSVVRESSYDLTFWAKADRPRIISVKIKRGRAPWDVIGLKEDVRLTPQWQQFKLGFIGADTEADASLVFSGMGLQSGARFELAKVSLMGGGKELLSAGDFASQDNAWRFIAPSNAVAEWQIVDLQQTNTLKIDVKSPGDNPWDVRLMQRDLTLRGGSRYRLGLWAKARQHQSVVIKLKDAPTSTVFSETISLNRDWQRYETTFYADRTATVDLLFTGIGDNINDYDLADVSLREVGRYDQKSGIYAVWYNTPSVLDIDFVRGGQAMKYWSDVETSKGNYSFDGLDQKIAQAISRGKYVTIQINGNGHPDYLFDNVPFHIGVIGGRVNRNVDGGRSLQYWHPFYKEAYANLLRALSDHIANADYRDKVLGVRMNFNALGTEGIYVPPDKREYSIGGNWVLPHSGVQWGGDWTGDVQDDYVKLIFDTYYEEFTKKDIWVFARSRNWYPKLPRSWFSEGKMGLFDTGSEIEPRSRFMEKGQEKFLAYSRTGQTVALAEAWHDMWYDHPKPHPRIVSPVQWNYWRLLEDLNGGVSFLAARGGELEAILPENGYDLEFRVEISAAFEFASRYAGRHADPIAAPGAWVALRDGVYLNGDYDFLMSRVPGDANVSLPSDLDEQQDYLSYGPSTQRFGAWARRIPPAGQMRFRLDDMFARSLDEKPATLRVVYLDDVQGSFDVTFSGSTATTTLNGTGAWKEAEYSIDNAFFVPDDDGAEIIIETNSNNYLTLHMVEVKRRNGVK